MILGVLSSALGSASAQMGGLASGVESPFTATADIWVLMPADDYRVLMPPDEETVLM